MKLAILTQILGWVLPIVLGPLVYAAARELLNAHRRVDDLPPLLKRLAVVALSALTVATFNVLGVALPPECYANETFTLSDACAQAFNAPTVVRSVTAAAVAMIIHAIKKSKPND